MSTPNVPITLHGDNTITSAGGVTYALVPVPPGWTPCPDPSQLADGTEVNVGPVIGAWNGKNDGPWIGFVDDDDRPFHWVLRGTPVFTRTQPPQPEPQWRWGVRYVTGHECWLATEEAARNAAHAFYETVLLRRPADDSGPVETVTQQPETTQRCSWDLGTRPSWMSPDQYDPCQCTLNEGHDGPHACEHEPLADPDPAEQPTYQPGAFHWSFKAGGVVMRRPAGLWAVIGNEGSLTDAQVGADTATLPPITPPQTSPVPPTGDDDRTDPSHAHGEQSSATQDGTGEHDTPLQPGDPITATHKDGTVLVGDLVVRDGASRVWSYTLGAEFNVFGPSWTVTRRTP